MKKILAMALALVMVFALVGCGGSKPASEAKDSAVKQVIKEAQGMTLEELCKKAIEESNGATFYGVGNSSRGKSALPLFIEYLQTLDPNYNLNFEWQQPKNNKIFDQLTADSLKDKGTFAVTLIQDGNQIESKMVKTGILDTFIPLDWANANGIKADEYKGYLPLQTLNKVFEYNCTGSKTFTNCWDFVAEGEHGLFMDVDSEIVGKNFLYMLTQEKYAKDLYDAFEALPEDKKAQFSVWSGRKRTSAGFTPLASAQPFGTKVSSTPVWTILLSIWLPSWISVIENVPLSFCASAVS